jgi:hypothetical protein
MQVGLVPEIDCLLRAKIRLVRGLGMEKSPCEVPLGGARRRIRASTTEIPKELKLFSLTKEEKRVKSFRFGNIPKWKYYDH